MKDKIEFHISKEHINAGKPCDPNYCPIAIAFNPIVQAINPTWRVQVGPFRTFITKDLSTDEDDCETVYKFNNSVLVRNWIAMFDESNITFKPPGPTQLTANFEDATIKLTGEP